MNRHIVTLPSNWDALDWAREHCKSYVTMRSHIMNTTHGYYIDDSRTDFFFDDEKDAVWFRLRWS